MTLDDAYIEKLQAQLKFCDAAMKRWAVKTEIAPDHARMQLANDLESLRRKHATVQERLSQLRNSSAGAWHTVKAGLEVAWTDFSQALERATPNFRL